MEVVGCPPDHLVVPILSRGPSAGGPLSPCARKEEEEEDGPDAWEEEGA